MHVHVLRVLEYEPYDIGDEQRQPDQPDPDAQLEVLAQLFAVDVGPAQLHPGDSNACSHDALEARAGHETPRRAIAFEPADRVV